MGSVVTLLGLSAYTSVPRMSSLSLYPPAGGGALVTLLWTAPTKQHKNLGLQSQANNVKILALPLITTYPWANHLTSLPQFPHL